MIKRNQDSLNFINATADFLLVLFAYIFSSWLRLYILHGYLGNKALTGVMILASIFYAAGLLLMLAIMGFYSTTRIRKLSWKLKVLFLSTTISIFIVTAFIFAFQVEDISRGIILLFYLITLLLLGSKQILTNVVLNQLRAAGYNIKHEVIIGSGKLVERYIQDVGLEPGLGIQIEGTYKPDDETLENVLSRTDIDEAVIALEAEEYMHVIRLIALCEKNGLKYFVIPFYNNLIPNHPVIENVGKSKLINMRANRLEEVGWAALKRSFDFLVSLILILGLSPLLALLAIGVKLSSPGPILFKQTRVGFNRKPFQMLKFRSMVVNNEENTGWSTAVDNRRTKFGSFIRKTSLDELPQLFNVLKGEMSLVGPRPELPYFVDHFRETVPLYMVKHQVKPGMSGWAQVNGYRGDTSIPRRIEMDLWYIDNWSPLLDLRILVMTVGAMVHEEGVEPKEADVKVVVCSHKDYWMPSDELYIPLQVGAEGKKELRGFQGDNTGQNISSKNPNYCELTGLYWAWKNLDCEYLGLAHYRRHFTLKTGTMDRRDVLTIDQIRRLVQKHDVILPKKRNYWIETNYSQYIHAHHKEDLDETRKIIEERYPEYIKAYDRSMKRTTGHRFNMFIMKKDVCDRYSSWLFDILFELEKRLDISDYSTNDKRVFGFVSERLLDVWLETNHVKYRDIPYIFLEKENWITKGVNFVLRKINKASMKGGI